MKQLLEQLKLAFHWVLANGYGVVFGIMCFLAAVEAVEPWVFRGVLFFSFLVWALRKSGVIKPLRK